MLSRLFKWLFEPRGVKLQLLPVKRLYVKKQGEWRLVWKKQPPPTPRRTWGANPDCPKCGSRCGHYDIHTRKVFCFGCRDVVYQLHHWPVPADYLTHHGETVPHLVPPQVR